MRGALESQRKLEQEFVADALNSETAPKGWPAALVMFHLAMWRERLRNALVDMEAGRDFTPPPSNIDEFNEVELATGIGTPLADGAARSDLLLGEIIELSGRLGERPFAWTVTKTTTEAVLRNSYTHPRVHLFEYLNENGRLDRAQRVWEEAAEQMRAIPAPPIILGAVLYNLATVRAAQDRAGDALDLLAEALPLRPDLRAAAADDDALAALRGNARFAELTR